MSTWWRRLDLKYFDTRFLIPEEDMFYDNLRGCAGLYAELTDKKKRNFSSLTYNTEEYYQEGVA